MPKKATIKYRSLRSNLVHLPLSLYAQLAQSQTASPTLQASFQNHTADGQRPQGIILHLLPLVSGSSSNRVKEAYVGWSGLAAASSLGLSGVGEGKEVLETLEMDPEVAGSLSMPEGTIVSCHLGDR
jgi:peroxin-1